MASWFLIGSRVVVVSIELISAGIKIGLGIRFMLILIRSFSGRIVQRRSVLLLISVLLISAALLRVDLGDMARLAQQLSFGDVVLAAVLLTINQAVSSIRYHALTNDFGIHQSFTQSHRDNILSIAGGVFFFSALGQSLARSSLLRREKKPAVYGVLITVVERVFSLLSLLALAVIFAFVSFGEINVLSAIKARAIAMTAAAVVVGFLVLKFSLSLRRRVFLRRFLFPMNVRLYLVICLSVLMHLLMLLAYVVLAASLVPEVPMLELVLPACSVMLGASLPISFGGWGVRELTAVYVFSMAGLAPEVGATMAVGVGVLSILALLLNMLIVMVKRIPLHLREDAREGRPVSRRVLGVLAWLIPVSCAAAVGFQFHLPTASGFLSVNVADALAICGVMVVAFLVRPLTRVADVWRIPGLTAVLILMVVEISVAFGVGWYRYGLIHWALFNRFVGIFVLCSYILCGSSAVALNGRRIQKSILSAYVVSVVGVILVEWVLRSFNQLFVSDYVFFLQPQYMGFSNNPNAFALCILLALAILLSEVVDQRNWPSWAIPALGGILLVGLRFTGSRAGYGAAFCLLIFFLSVRSFRRWPHLIFFTLVFLGISLLPSLVDMRTTGLGPLEGVLINRDRFGFTHLPQDRWESYLWGFRMWVEHPLLGKGLGAFLAEYQPRNGEQMVLHSAYLWLLAEMGLIGFVIYGLFPGIILYSIFREPGWRTHGPSLAVVGCLIVIGVMSMLHDMTFQRSFWLLVGTLLAQPGALRGRAQPGS